MSLGVFLRRARPSDAVALARLETASFSRPWTEAQIADEIAHAGPGIVLVLEGRADGADPGAAICAYCAVRLVLDEVHVMNVAVAPAQRRRGLGRWLLTFALARASRAGARRALLEVRAGNHEALALYASLGFREIGRRRDYYRDPAEDALVLGREDLWEVGRRAPPAQP